MKSQANGLLKVAQGVLKDYLVTYPNDEVDVARDFERLTHLVEERGLATFTLDLPALDKALTSALENSRLIVEGALSKRASSTILVPRIFRGLWLRIFDHRGNLLEDADPTAIFFLRQLLTLGKKVEVVCSPARIKSVMGEYYHVEREARVPTLSWGHDNLGSDDTCSFNDLFDHHSTCGGDQQLELWEKPNILGTESDRAILRRCQQNFDIFAQALGTFGAEEFLSSIQKHSRGIGFRHGPGAVSDLTSKEYKYDFPTWSDKLGAIFPQFLYGTVGGAERPSYRKVLEMAFPLFSEKESYACEANPIGEMGITELVCNLQVSSRYTVGSSENSDDSTGEGFDPLDRTSPDLAYCSNHEPPSRLMSVPKTASAPRLIAAEPTAHQWCQQFIKRFIEERLQGLFGTNFVSFRNQELSRQLVSKASLDQSLATVDLSSASDRLTCWVIERAFRKNKSLLEALHSTRTRWVKDCVDKTQSPNYFIPKKFATQGTAVTFPIQSIIFLIIALTACGFEAKHPEDFICNKRLCGPLGRLRNKVRVFGDDIIIPVSGYGPLTHLLHLLGLKVNQDKSFVKGHFRESCGMDAFKGVNVTPIKAKCVTATGPQSRQSIIDYANNLHQAGLWYAAEAAESMLPDWVRKNLPVVGLGCGGAGRISFTGNGWDHLRKRWNRTLHRDEYYSYGLNARMKKTPTNTLSGLLQYFAEAPCPTTKWEHGIPGRSKTSDGLGWRPSYQGG
jgi:hypothetical protein